MIQDGRKCYADRLMRKKFSKLYHNACTDDAIDAYHIYIIANSYTMYDHTVYQGIQCTVVALLLVTQVTNPTVMISLEQC